MSKPIALLTGTGIGAALMYYFDPDRGMRRRSLVRDRVNRARSRARRSADVAVKDVTNRARGTFAELRSAIAPQLVPDEVLVERVRSKLGRCVSHPSSIQVSAHDGRVALSGSVLASEVHNVLSAVEAIRGVIGVRNSLDVHEESEHPELREGTLRRGEAPEFAKRRWSPTTRVAAGTAGAALMANCLARRTPLAVMAGTFGFGLSLRALTNLETRRLLGVSRGRRGIDIHKTIVIDAPIGRAFALLSDPENYPRFTDSVKSVRALGDGRYEKMIRAPGGKEVKLEETITERHHNDLFAWRSGPNSTLKYAGTAWFTDLGHDRTQVHFYMTYNPPGGVISHAAAWLAGMDPKHQLDNILMRAKSYLETGVQPRDAADRSQPELREAEHQPT
jgi:uncharacterized membrane protein